MALKAATRWLMDEEVLKSDPVTGQLAAISAGLVDGTARLDLEYEEDRVAEADANFVLTDTGGIVEVQMTAEEDPVSQAHFDEIFALARKGVGELCEIQLAALKR